MKKMLLLLILCSLSFWGYSQLYYKDVAPIFIERCTSCHNQYGHVSLLNYSQTLAEAPTITSYLQTGEMPPWPPDTTYTRFVHERHISTSEKNAILAWIAGGSLPGDTTQAQTPPPYTRYQLRGTPDLVLKAPVFVSNAAHNDSYICFSLPSGLTQDRILRAYEILAGTPSIVHHVIANVDTSAITVTDTSGTCYTAPGDFSIGGYAPGSEPTVFPGTAPLTAGIRIKAGSKIVLQVHYPAGTAGGVDSSTQIRLYFYPVGATGIRHVYVTTPLQNWNMTIPPNTVTTYTAQYPASGGIPYAISVFGVFPHSHKVCRSIVNYAFSATDTVPLVRINNWQFNWQGYYTYKKLAVLTAGHTFYSIHVYDNTANNPNNPFNPPQQIVSGTSTTNEMLFDSYQWLVYEPGDENIDINSLLTNDTLLAAGIRNEFNPLANELRTYSYPNPFNQFVNIGYELQDPARVSIEIYSIYGMRVKTILGADEFTGTHAQVWNGTNDAGAHLPPGEYLYLLKAGTKQCSGKVSLMPE